MPWVFWKYFTSGYMKSVFWGFFCFTTMHCDKLLSVLLFTFLSVFTFTWIFLTSSLHFDVEQWLAHKSANQALAAPDNHREKLLRIYSWDTVELGEHFGTVTWQLDESVQQRNNENLGSNCWRSVVLAASLHFKYVVIKWNIQSCLIHYMHPEKMPENITAR